MQHSNWSGKQIKLIFVYNADSGLFNSLTDFAHKLISPDSYKCSLCKLTYGKMNMKKEWRDFIHKIPHEVQFLHRDEFLKLHPLQDPQLPMVLIENQGNLKILVDQQELNSSQDLKSLMKLVQKKLDV